MAQEKNNKPTRSQRYKEIGSLIAVVGTSVACLAAFAFWFVLRRNGASTYPPDWGVFGDYFGGIAGTLVSLVALYALVMNIRLQSEELEDTRAQLDQQRRVMNRQAFDSMFFQLLGQFREVASNVRCEAVATGRVVVGRPAFEELADQLSKGWFPDDFYPDGRPKGEAELLELQDLFAKLYRLHEPELGPYFRSLYHIFKFIDENTTRSKGRKVRYANIARAQLSKYELVLLFYNCLYGEGIEFRPLIEKYGVLRHVSRPSLLKGSHWENRLFYRASAFQKSADRQADRQTEIQKPD
jgi:hypothetical protein